MSTCPSTTELTRYLHATASENIPEHLVRHVENCEACERAFEQLDGVSFPHCRPAEVASAFADEPQLRALLKRLQGVRPDRGRPVSPRDTLVGKTLRDYELLDVLGHGGMGTVYLARHTRLKKRVAVKVLSHRSGDASVQTRFVREVEAVGQLEHPNVVQALDADEADGLLFLVMEFIDGVDVSQVVRDSGTLGVADACEICRQAATGLQYAHNTGLVHRDIKPSNLMLTTSPDEVACVKVLDLGLALTERLADENAPLTDHGQLMGTLEFMAPEQTEDTHTVDERADIYSLGATLYRLLTGTLPFAGPRFGTPMKRLRALASSTPPSAATHRDDLPTEIVDLLERMLSTLPENRPVRMQEIVDILQVHASGHRLSDLLKTARRKVTADSPTATSVADLVDTTPSIADTIVTSRGAEQVVPANESNGNPVARRTIFGIVAVLVFAAFVTWGSLQPNSRTDVPTPTDGTNSFSDRQDSPGPETYAPDEASVIATLHEGLQGLWAFENTEVSYVPDWSGNGLHGSLNTSSTASLRGKGAPLTGSQYSLRVSGRNDYVEIPGAAELDSGGPMTIALWIRGRSSRNEEPAAIFTRHDEAGGYGLFVSGTAAEQHGHVELSISGRTSIDHVKSTQSVLNRTWHHIVATHDGSELRLYIDGNLDASVIVSQPIEENVGPLRIGPHDESGFHGELDEVCLYNRALTAEEARALSFSRPAPPLDITPATTHRPLRIQEALAARLGVPVEFTDSAGIRFRLIPAGEFQMGITDEEFATLSSLDKSDSVRERLEAEKPRHKVQISLPFYMALHEVTQNQYANVTGDNPSFFSDTGKGHEVVADTETGDLPVENVSWNDCVLFCNMLAERAGLNVCYGTVGDSFTSLDHDGYRLPTEAEWEFACRAGTTDLWSYGGRQDNSKPFEWNIINSKQRTHPVGTKKANGFGLHDMHGNVFEWCEDWYTPYPLDAATDPTSSDFGTHRVYRGGSWWQRRSRSHSAYRGSHFPGFRFKEHGFRVVLSVDAARNIFSGSENEISSTEIMGPLTRPIESNGNPKADESDYRRTVAEWVIEHSGTVSLSHELSVNSIDQLPAEPFQITGVTMQYLTEDDAQQAAARMLRIPECRIAYLGSEYIDRDAVPPYSDTSMAAIGQLTQLQTLCLVKADVSDEGLRQLQPSHNLRRISLQDLSFTATGMMHVQQSFPNLETLGIRSNSLAPEVLTPLPNMKNLRSVDLTIPVVTPEPLQAVAKSSVTWLMFRGTHHFEPGAIAVIARIPHLRTFALQNADFGDEQLKELSECQALKILNLQGTNLLTEAGLRAFAKARPEVRIEIKWGPPALNALADIPQVTVE